MPFRLLVALTKVDIKNHSLLDVTQFSLVRILLPLRRHHTHGVTSQNVVLFNVWLNFSFKTSEVKACNISNFVRRQFKCLGYLSVVGRESTHLAPVVHYLMARRHRNSGRETRRSQLGRTKRRWGTMLSIKVKGLVMSLAGNQEWLCWRGPATIYSTDIRL
jgi:hypothetical protein